MSDIPPVIPLFPLADVVLFPQMPLPLHVFEPRYRRMVADVMEGAKVIGMALLRPGWEGDYEGRPAVYEAGCAGLIERCQPLPDGRFNILLKGLSRFRIREEHAGRPYRLASVEPLADQLGEPAAVEEARRRLLELVGRAAEGPVVLVAQPELPHELFVNALCQSLTLAAVEKQSLLDCETILGRYQRLFAILEFRLLERTFGAGGSNQH